MLHSIIRKMALCAVLYISLFGSLTAQITVPKGNFQFDFPGERWKYLETLDIDKSTTVYLYSRVKEIVSANGDTVLPFLRIYVKSDIGNKNVMDMSMERFMQQPFNVVDEFSTSEYFKAKDAIGYIGVVKYNDTPDGQFYMIYFTNKGVLVEFRLETEKSTFATMKAEFEEILNTIVLN